MNRKTGSALAYVMRAILLSLALTTALSACSDSQPPCASNGTCYQAPQPFYGGSFYMNRGGFAYGGRSR